MTNVLAIIILATGFSVAVETDRGFVEKSFANTPAGAEEFWTFAEPLVKREGKKVKVCTVTLAEESGAVMEWLLRKDFGPALLSRIRFAEYAARTGAPSESATTVAMACLSTFPFIRSAR